jgi:hypothetical protein
MGNRIGGSFGPNAWVEQLAAWNRSVVYCSLEVIACSEQQ